MRQNTATIDSIVDPTRGSDVPFSGVGLHAWKWGLIVGTEGIDDAPPTRG
jgi:hypothetical protein